MNVDLLNRIKERILGEPRQFLIEGWNQADKIWNGETYIDIPNCGTACCIAGWATCLSRGENPSILNSIPNTGMLGRIALDLSIEQAEELFYIDNWPAEFRNAYYRTVDLTEKAKIACQRIDNFIKYYED